MSSSNMNTAIKTISMIIERAEKKEIEAFLLRDTVWASEAICTLDDTPDAEWFAAREGGVVKAAMMVCPKFSPTPVFFAGTATGLPGLLDTAKKYRSVFLECPLDFIGLIKLKYAFSSHRIMARMLLEREVSATASPDISARRLTAADLKGAFDLYKDVTGDASGFDSLQFIQGIYYGIEGPGGRLLSAAGTQAVSACYGVATIGNVITRQEARGHGYATACLLALTDELKKKFSRIVINVNRGDRAAINIYRKCGFVKEMEYFEGEGIRKEV
jgi:ribosomal protein S18 acetylase RimI-like enzyme